MATERRSLLFDGPVNPAIMSGLCLIVDTFTGTANDKDIVYTFPAKTINGVFVSASAGVDTEKVVWTSSVTSDVGTVTFTITTASTNKFSIMIWYTKTETIDAASIADDASITAMK